MEQRTAAHGIFLALGVFAATRAIDVLHGVIVTLSALVGLSPANGVGTAVAVHAALALVALLGKLYLLAVLIRAPRRLDWMVGSWAAPIALAVLALVSVPALQFLGTVQQLALFETGMATVDIGQWFYARAIVSMVASWANAALWAGALLLAYARVRRASDQPAAA